MIDVSYIDTGDSINRDTPAWSSPGTRPPPRTRAIHRPLSAVPRAIRPKPVIHTK